MANTEIRWIVFFVAKDGEALYSWQKQEQELTVAQIMNSLLPYCNVGDLDSIPGLGRSPGGEHANPLRILA